MASARDPPQRPTGVLAQCYAGPPGGNYLPFLFCMGAATALRLSRYFGTSEGFWMELQADYELEEARNCLGKRLQQEVRSHAA